MLGVPVHFDRSSSEISAEVDHTSSTLRFEWTNSSGPVNPTQAPLSTKQYRSQGDLIPFWLPSIPLLTPNQKFTVAMQSDPAFAVLAPYIDQYPAQAGALYTTYTDICLSHQWKDVRILALQREGWVVLFGRKALTDPIRLILPLAINTNSLTPAALKAVFSALNEMEVNTLPETLPPIVEVPEAGLITDQAEEEESAEVTLDKETIYISIATPDSSVVYYKLSKGIKKPQDVPDE